MRFILTLDVQPMNVYYGQTVIVTKDFEARERVRARITEQLKKDFAGIDTYVNLLALGPPAGRAVQYRVSGPDMQNVRALAQELAGIVGSDPNLSSPVYDWNEPARVVKVDVLQDKARQLGISSADIATALNITVGGAAITQVRDYIYLINVVARAADAERGAIETLQNMQLFSKTGQPVPLAAIATFRYEMEQPVIWRRNRLPTVTVKADILDGRQPATVIGQLDSAVKSFIERLPAGYRLAIGGPIEESAKSQRPISDVVPLMLLIMATILMLQLQSFNRLFLVASVAPLAVIGVALALLLSGSPLGFVAILGVIALIGILIRNSVILVVEIETLRKEGLGAVGGRCEGLGASFAAYYAHGLGCEPWPGPDCARRVLGANGLCHDRRHPSRHSADAPVPARSLCRLVQDQRAKGGLLYQGDRACGLTSKSSYKLRSGNETGVAWLE